MNYYELDKEYVLNTYKRIPLNVASAKGGYVYDENGIFLWNISELLKNYSDKFCIKYYDELYFDIRILDKEMIFCIGFNNHCEIDLKSKAITRLVCNR